MSYIESLHKNAVRALHFCLFRALIPDVRRKIIIFALKSISSLEWAPGLTLVKDYRDYGDIFVAVCAPKGWVIDFDNHVPPLLYGIGSTGEKIITIHPAKVAKLRLLLRPETRIEKYVTQVERVINTTYAKSILILFCIWAMYDFHMYYNRF